jgi:hypothetical protein
MCSALSRVAIALAVVVIATGVDAQMPGRDWPASNGWNTANWPTRTAGLQRLPRCEQDLNAAGPTFIGDLPTQPYFAAQSVAYEGPVDLSADGKCDTKTKDCAPCCPPAWAHRCGVFGEYLLLRPRDAEVSYGVPINGPIVRPPADPVQVGPVAIVDPDYSTGFRVGGSFAFDWCSSVVLTYSHFESNTEHSITTDPTEAVIRPLVMHPSMFEANTDALAAQAGLGIDFDTLDADYRSVLWLNHCSVMNWFVGARYAHLQQDFASLFTLTGENEEVITDVGFDGGGIRFGLDGERHHCCGFLLYGRGSISVVAGEFSATYFQADNFDREIVDTAWKAGRVVPIMDLELGAGWQSPCGHFRLTAGYNVAYWFNTVTTDQWIKSVQENDFVGQPDGMSYDTITFDGLTARAEYRF